MPARPADDKCAGRLKDQVRVRDVQCSERFIRRNPSRSETLQWWHCLSVGTGVPRGSARQLTTRLKIRTCLDIICIGQLPVQTDTARLHRLVETVARRTSTPTAAHTHGRKQSSQRLATEPRRASSDWWGSDAFLPLRTHAWVRHLRSGQRLRCGQQSVLCMAHKSATMTCSLA